jgi:hypothetical protein
MQRPIEAEFHVLGENQLSGADQWSAWFEGFIGMAVNHAINLGFDEWKPVAEWHFRHLEWRCGGKWPIKACDNDHVSVAPHGTWADTPPYDPERMACYLAAPSDELMPSKCDGVYMTYDDRAQIARSWAAMAAINGVRGASQMYLKLDGLVQRRGGVSWFKYAMLPRAASGERTVSSPLAAPGADARPMVEARSPLVTAPSWEEMKAQKLRLRQAQDKQTQQQQQTQVKAPEQALEQDQDQDQKPHQGQQQPPSQQPYRFKSNALSDLSPGTWFEIPASKIIDVLPPESFQQPIHYIVGPKAITGAWNGAVFNTDLQRLDIFSAGGHADYCGNEYLAFSLQTLKWELVHGPSDLAGFDLKSGTITGAQPHAMGLAPDGKPISRHTYGGQVYHPPLKKSFMFGGSLCSGAGTADDRWWSVTPDGQYTQLGGVGAWASLGMSAEYDPKSQHIFLTQAGNVTEFDPDRNEKIRRSNIGSNGRWGQVSAIDSRRNRLFVFGHYSPGNSASGAFTYDLATGSTQAITLSGDLTIIERPGIGLEYIPELDLFAAWIEGPMLYLIDPESFHITAYRTRGTPPPGASPNGIYGRFAYSAAYGGFVVVSAVDRNVFFLKLPVGSRNGVPL